MSPLFNREPSHTDMNKTRAKIKWNPACARFEAYLLDDGQEKADPLYLQDPKTGETQVSWELDVSGAPELIKAGADGLELGRDHPFQKGSFRSERDNVYSARHLTTIQDSKQEYDLYVVVRLGVMKPGCADLNVAGAIDPEPPPVIKSGPRP